MLTSKFKVSLTLNSPKTSRKEDWYSSLKNIYGSEGPNFDGYVSSLESLTGFNLTVECYTLEGPEEASRLSELKDQVPDWNKYKKDAVAAAIVSHGTKMGYLIESYSTESIPL